MQDSQKKKGKPIPRWKISSGILNDDMYDRSRAKGRGHIQENVEERFCSVRSDREEVAGAVRKPGNFKNRLNNLSRDSGGFISAIMFSSIKSIR
jgi:hypothetical protein